MTTPTPLPRRAAQTLEQLEIEMANFNAPPPHPPTARDLKVARTIPDPTPPDLGELSAEAVLTQYEAAARAVEEMGDAVKVRVHNIAAALLEADADMKEIAETAKAIMEKGKLVQTQIEEASELSNSIRAACVEFKRKVGLP